MRFRDGMPWTVAVLSLLTGIRDARAQTVIQVSNTVQQGGVKRLGINLGDREPWAASQIMKNLIPNPGFEAGIYGMVVHPTAAATGQRIPQSFWVTDWNDDALGIGQPPGFWDGAAYEFVYGPALGRSGTVTQYTHENSEGVFYLDQNGTAPNALDVLFVRRNVAFTSHAGAHAFVDTTTTRPGSSGAQSLRLLSTGVSWQASWVQYLDTAWSGASNAWQSGKLLPIEGNWEIDLWARAAVAGQALQVRFERLGEALFFNETIPLTGQWQRITRSFSVAPGVDSKGPFGPNDPHNVLALSLLVPDPAAQIWVDDASLRSTDDTNPTAFVDELVHELQALRPGILRNSGNVHGDTLDNQLADPFARRTHGFSPAERNPDAYSYSLHEFLELCREVGAEPWHVIPDVFSPADLVNLMEYLGAPADGAHPYADRRAALGQAAPWTGVFSTLHLEFGNEGWGAGSPGDPFYGASLIDGTRLGQIAEDRFQLMQATPWYDAGKVKLVIGGQASFPGRQTQIQSNSSVHDAVGIAPYFGERLEVYATDEDRYWPLWAHAQEDVLPGGLVRTSKDNLDVFGRGTELSTYEMNFHTTQTDVFLPLDVRNDFVTGMGGALALPLYSLFYLRDLGVRNQCMFQTLQYQTDLGNGEAARLFGLLRDLHGTGRRRPAWVGMQLTNEALGDDLLTTTVTGSPTFTQGPQNDLQGTVTMPLVHAFTFREGALRHMLLFNLDLAQKHLVRLQLAQDPRVKVVVIGAVLSASIHDDNEDAMVVDILRLVLPGFANGAQFRLPAHSLVKLTWLE